MPLKSPAASNPQPRPRQPQPHHLTSQPSPAQPSPNSKSRLASSPAARPQIRNQVINKMSVFGLTGHDLIAFKIKDADAIFFRLQVKSQKHFYLLASGTMPVTGHLGPNGRPHIACWSLYNAPVDRTTGTVHHAASAYPGMSGSPLVAQHKGKSCV